jgi:hypothetical protein
VIRGTHVALLTLFPVALVGLLWLAAGAFASLAAARGQGLADQVAILPVPSPDRRLDSPVDPRLVEAERSYAWAVRLDPLEPDHRQGLARVLELRAARLPPGDRDARALLAQAVDLYLSAARDRPSWPYTWLALARVKARLGALDADFTSAIGSASRRGPWDARLQGLLLELLIPLWDLLGPEAREVGAGALRRGLLIQPSEVLGIAVRAGRADLVAPLVQGDEAREAMLRKHVRSQAPAPGAGG